ncbi:uncharacterized protein LOC108739831 isoform X2 [Agrilus planipennis]|uniref:L antigen family member 3 n=1 Tax=Agrilus planipennis TaxID=224129 RepID=A0A1W4WZZ4_AGRPL|nr:uncharacterized protein LOC108739831 isoform X2 [Agrilus planipennis]
MRMRKEKVLFIKIIMNDIAIEIKVPFPTKRVAQIVYDVLRVDKEPRRSQVNKELSVKDRILIGNFSGRLAKQLRVAVNNFFDNINLILSTIDQFGPPVSDYYHHY